MHLRKEARELSAVISDVTYSICTIHKMNIRDMVDEDSMDPIKTL